MEVMGGYGPLLDPPEVMSRAAKVAKTLKSRTPVRLYVYETLLQRLAPDLEDMAPELWPCIQEEHAVVRQRHLARPGEVPAAEQPHVRDRLMGGATRAGRDQGCAGAREAGDAVEARGLDGVSEDHRWQDGPEGAGQYRLPRSRRAQQESERPQDMAL